MSPEARELFKTLSEEVESLGDVIELAESKSVSYHASYFFLEVLPWKYELILLLPLDFNEVDDTNEIDGGTNDWEFIPNAKYDGGTIMYAREQEHIGAAIPIIRQSFNKQAFQFILLIQDLPDLPS